MVEAYEIFRRSVRVGFRPIVCLESRRGERACAMDESRLQGILKAREQAGTFRSVKTYNTDDLLDLVSHLFSPSVSHPVTVGE